MQYSKKDLMEELYRSSEYRLNVFYSLKNLFCFNVLQEYCDGAAKGECGADGGGRRTGVAAATASGGSEMRGK